MKVRFPLSLKVTLWLLLNLFLLGAAAIAFLVAQGGLSWDSLVIGTPGDRMHSLANIVAGEVAAAPRSSRDAVLERFAAEYHANFIVVRNRGPVVAGLGEDLPKPVRQRVDEGPPEAGRRMGPPEMDGPGGPDGPGREDPGLPGLPRDGEAGPRGGGRGRFLVRTATPAEWWIGFRVPFREAGSRPGPATLIVRTASFWSVVQLLNLQTWFLVGGSVLALSILFWLPLVRSITHHVRILTAATERIADGRFDTRVPAGRRDELGRLGESVNVMATRLDTLVNGQKRFLADIAHELGSPLGRLQVATEILETRAGPELQEHVADVREEVHQMSELLNELLAFTKAGMRRRDAELGSVSLREVVDQALARENGGPRVEVNVEPLNVLADAPLLSRAIGNLVRNALRYAPIGPIRVQAKSDGDRVILIVEDEGPGVPVDAVARLGEPFYRPEMARTRETGGVGLGLAIVRSGVAACGGEVHFSNRKPAGFRAEIRLRAA